MFLFICCFCAAYIGNLHVDTLKPFVEMLRIHALVGSVLSDSRSAQGSKVCPASKSLANIAGKRPDIRSLAAMHAYLYIWHGIFQEFYFVDV